VMNTTMSSFQPLELCSLHQPSRSTQVFNCMALLHVQGHSWATARTPGYSPAPCPTPPSTLSVLVSTPRYLLAFFSRFTYTLLTLAAVTLTAAIHSQATLSAVCPHKSTYWSSPQSKALIFSESVPSSKNLRAFPATPVWS
jgi:hypothetical protein